MALVMPNGQPQPAQQGTWQNAYNQVQNAYNQYLGRTGSVEEINSHLGGGRNYQPQNVGHAIGNIYNSPEAQAYRNKPQQETPNVDTTGGSNNTPAPQNQGYPSAPSVPPVYSGPNLNDLMRNAGQSAQQIQSQFVPQQIQNFQAPNYTQTVFSQFQDPRNQNVQAGRDNLLLSILQNPESMSQLWQDQMFETQKDSALSFAKQLGLQQEQNLAGRGFSNMDPYSLGLQNDLQAQLGSELLKGRRDIATQAAQTNFANRLQALGAGETGLSGDLSRGAEVYRNTLLGQDAQAKENQYLQSNARDNYNSYLSGRGLQGQENARAEQFRQSAFGLSEQARENAVQQALQAFLAQNNSDLGWANYGLNADQQAINFWNNWT